MTDATLLPLVGAVGGAEQVDGEERGPVDVGLPVQSPPAVQVVADRRAGQMTQRPVLGGEVGRVEAGGTGPQEQVAAFGFDGDLGPVEGLFGDLVDGVAVVAEGAGDIVLGGVGGGEVADVGDPHGCLSCER